MDTGSTGTLMPLSTIRKLGFEKRVDYFKHHERLKINGLGGASFIIGVLEGEPITFGNRIFIPTIGVVDGGSFEMLLGNDSIAELKMAIDVATLSCTYEHP